MCSSDYAVSEKDIIQGKKQHSKNNQRQNGLHRTRVSRIDFLAKEKDH